MSGTLQNAKVTRDEKSWEVEIVAEIPAEVLAKYRDHAIKDIQKEAKLDGFRPGKTPLDRILQVYGEPAIMREAAQQAIQNELPEFLASEKLLIIESPRVTTDAPEAGKPLKFTARAALAPSITLPDYKKVADKHPLDEKDTLVSDAEHTQAMTHLRRERARIEKIEAGTESEKANEESRTMKEEELPVLDDTFVQSLGYENAEKFSEALRTNIKTEKEMQAREKRRAAILDTLVKDSKISYPITLREYELDDMEARVKDDLTRAGQTFEGYLEQVKKTREQLRTEWTDAADKRAKVRLTLTEIARKEGIEPDKKMLEHELEHATKRYPQADPIAMRAHIAHAMRNDATLRFLEGEKPETEHHHHHDHDHDHKGHDHKHKDHDH